MVFNVALFELVLQGGDQAQLGGANWGVVCGVREQNDPAIACPVVKFNFAHRRVLCEIGGDVA